MTAVVFDSAVLTITSGVAGVIAGEGVGIVTLDNVPGVAVVDLLRRSDNAWLRRTISAVDGTYSFTGLAFGVEHNVIARDITNTWDDVIVGRVLPFKPVALTGDAPGCVEGVPYLFTYAVSGGELPYAFTLTGDLPDGLTLVATTSTVEISGTPTSLAATQTFEIEVEDVRGSTAAVMDTMAVYAAGSHRYWRMNATASNSHLAIAEMQMAAVAGGANLCSGGTAIASGYYPSGGGYSYFPAQAFDGALVGATAVWASDVAGSGYLGYVFAEPVKIEEVRICSRTEAPQSPRDFTIQSSDDGITWTVEATYTGITAWTAGVLTPFAV